MAPDKMIKYEDKEITDKRADRRWKREKVHLKIENTKDKMWKEPQRKL